MKVLFDQGTPVPLRRALLDHVVETAHERGWSSLKNGDLIAVAESSGFRVLVTTDKRLRYQQNLAARTLAVVVLSTTSWPRIQGAIEEVVAAVNEAGVGTYREVSIP